MLEETKEGENLRLKWKNLIRKGVPNQFKRIVILKMFNIDEIDSKFVYDSALKSVFLVISFLSFYLSSVFRIEFLQDLLLMFPHSQIQAP
jgi:hypothetical protein